MVAWIFRSWRTGLPEGSAISHQENIILVQCRIARLSRHTPVHKPRQQPVEMVRPHFATRRISSAVIQP